MNENKQMIVESKLNKKNIDILIIEEAAKTTKGMTGRISEYGYYAYEQ